MARTTGFPTTRRADPATQVQQSFASSLEHLRTTYVDSYVLHGPSSRRGLTDEDWAVWRAMETLQQGGQARRLGVSNVSLEQLVTLHRRQRGQARLRAEPLLRDQRLGRGRRAPSAREHGIAYQGFSLLTANARELASPAVASVRPSAPAAPRPRSCSASRSRWA